MCVYTYVSKCVDCQRFPYLDACNEAAWLVIVYCTLICMSFCVLLLLLLQLLFSIFKVTLMSADLLGDPRRQLADCKFIYVCVSLFVLLLLLLLNFQGESLDGERRNVQGGSVEGRTFVVSGLSMF